MVPARRKGQKPILFRQIKSELMSREESESENELPQFTHYEPNVLRMIESMGYDLTNGPELNFGKGRRTLLQSFVPKGKGPDYYHQTRRGLGYVSTPIPSASESEKLLYHDYSSGTSSWDSNVSISNLFRELSVYMISASQLEDRGEEMIQADTDPWIRHLNTLWDMRFEQREPPTEDKVAQIKLGDEANPKPIFISEILSSSEKEDLISLVQ